MRHLLPAALIAAAALLSGAAAAQELTFPSSFREQKIATNGTSLHVRVGATIALVRPFHTQGK